MQAVDNISRWSSLFGVIGEFLLCSWLGYCSYLLHQLSLVVLFVLWSFLLFCFFLFIGIFWFWSFELLLLILNIGLWLRDDRLLWLWCFNYWWCWGWAQFLELFFPLLLFRLRCCLCLSALSQQRNLLFNMRSSPRVAHSFSRCIKRFPWDLDWPTMTHKLRQIILILTFGCVIEPDLAEFGMIPVLMYSVERLRLPQLDGNQIQFTQLRLLRKQSRILPTELLLDLHIKPKCLERGKQALVNLQLGLPLETGELWIGIWDTLHLQITRITIKDFVFKSWFHLSHQ